MKLKLAAAAVLAMICAVPANAATQTFDVGANAHVWNGGAGFGGNLGLDTGITLTAGEAFEAFVTNPGDTWKYCPNTTDCTVNADGFRVFTNTDLGPYTNSGFSFTFGTLVGRIGGGDFFQIGTAGFDGLANATGALKLFHWDHNTNNSDSIRVTVETNLAPVPLPASLPLLAVGLGAVGLMSRRKKKRAA